MRRRRRAGKRKKMLKARVMQLKEDIVNDFAKARPLAARRSPDSTHFAPPPGLLL